MEQTLSTYSWGHIVATASKIIAVLRLPRFRDGFSHPSRLQALVVSAVISNTVSIPPKAREKNSIYWRLQERPIFILEGYV
jgi:hypothetical protein